MLRKLADLKKESGRVNPRQISEDHGNSSLNEVKADRPTALGRARPAIPTAQGQSLATKFALRKIGVQKSISVETEPTSIKEIKKLDSKKSRLKALKKYISSMTDDYSDDEGYNSE